MGSAVELAAKVAKKVGLFFYIANPKETTFEHEDQVPNYLVEAFPIFICIILAEQLIVRKKRGTWIPISDSLTSMVCGIMKKTYHLVAKGMQVTSYVYIYRNYHLAELPWDSVYTWIAAAFCFDFGYYWAHRAAHEVNLFWSAHQVHHSSEEYNLTTAARQAVFQDWCNMFAFGFLALFMPPSHYLVHMNINLLYQYWLHTELVDSLGPLESVLNTPSHHRVHHGSTKYCIDKNYGGVLIIWDRIFGTFAWERRDEPMVYGLIEQVDSFNPLYLQLFYLGKVYDKFRSVSGFGNKLKAIFYGPGWFPGTPRLGDPDCLPETLVREKFSMPTTNKAKLYAAVHFLILFPGLSILSTYKQELAPIALNAACAYLIFSFTSLGLVLNTSHWACWSETARCIVFLGFSMQPSVTELPVPYALLITLQTIFLISAVVNQSYCITNLSTTKLKIA